MEKLTELAACLHDHEGLDDAYAGLTDDVRLSIEAQVPLGLPSSQQYDHANDFTPGRYVVPPDDHFLRALQRLLRTFFTNSVDVNLALTQAIIAIAVCVEIRLDSWFAMEPQSYSFDSSTLGAQKPWQSYLDEQEDTALIALQRASRRPVWVNDNAPMVYSTLEALVAELETVRSSLPNLDQLIFGRKTMLQAANLDAPLMSNDNGSSPTQPSFLGMLTPSRGHSRSSSQSSLARGRNKASNVGSPHSASLATSPAPMRTVQPDVSISSSVNALKSIFMPPPQDAPSTTDVLMQQITFPSLKAEHDQATSADEESERKASLNHVLTNALVLQELLLELIAVMQVRAAVLREKEVRFV